MRKTKKSIHSCEKLSVDIHELASLLSCGESTARKIGMESGARIRVGRRVLYSLDKVKEYLSSQTD